RRRVKLSAPSAEQLVDRRAEAGDRRAAVTAERRAVHDRERRRRERRETPQGGARVGRVRHVLRERRMEPARDRLARALDDARLDQRLALAGLEEQIGAEQRALGLVEV